MEQKILKYGLCGMSVDDYIAIYKYDKKLLLSPLINVNMFNVTKKLNIKNDIEFIKDNKDRLEWHLLSRQISLNDIELLDTFSDKIRWTNIRYIPIDLDTFIKYKDKFEKRIQFKSLKYYSKKYRKYIQWGNFRHFDSLPVQFMTKFKHQIIWRKIHHKFYINHLDIFYDKVDWNQISRLDSIDDAFAIKWRKYINRRLINLNYVSEQYIDDNFEVLPRGNINYRRGIYSNNFMQKHKNHLPNTTLLRSLFLTEDEIEKIQTFNVYDFNFMSINYKLSEKFIRKHINNLNLKEIVLHQNVSKKFLEEHAIYFGLENLSVDNAFKLGTTSVGIELFELCNLDYFIRDIWKIILKYSRF